MPNYYRRYSCTDVLAVVVFWGLISCQEDTPAPVFCTWCGNDSGVDDSDPCNDGRRLGYETDIDCGGEECDPCELGQTCLEHSDCVSRTCIAGLCQEPSCNDFIQNSTETDVDCGSGCLPCIDGSGCQDDSDCMSGTCSGNECSGSVSVEVEFPSTLSSLDGPYVHENGGWFIAGGTFWEEAFTLEELPSIYGINLAFEINDTTDIRVQGSHRMTWIVTINDQKVAEIPYHVGEDPGIVSLEYTMVFEEIERSEEYGYLVRFEQEEDYCENPDLCGAYQFTLPGNLIFYGRE